VFQAKVNEGKERKEKKEEQSMLKLAPNRSSGSKGDYGEERVVGQRIRRKV